MVKRKLLSAMITYFITTLAFSTSFLLSGWFPNNEQSPTFMDSLFIISLCNIGGLILYGLPISILIEFISKKIEKSRFYVALGGQILFGIIPTIVIGFWGLFFLIVSVIYFFVDEILRYYYFNNQKKQPVNT